jgi:ATP-binding cassette subfamily B protein
VSADEEELSVLEEYQEDVEHPLYRLFRDYGWDQVHWFALGVFTSTVARFLSLVPPVLLGVAIDSLFNDSTAYSIPFVPSSWIPAGQMNQFWFTVWLMGGALLLSAVMNFARASSMNLFSHRVKHDVRVACYRKMQRLDMDFFDDKQTGQLMSVLNNDTNRLELFLDNMMGAAIQLGVMVIGIAAILLYVNPSLALITLAVIPVAALFTKWFMSYVEQAYEEVRSSVGDLNTVLENNLAGIEVIKSSNTVEYEDERVTEASYEYFRRDWKALRANFVYRPGMQILTSIAFVATFVVGGLWLLEPSSLPFYEGQVQVGVLVTFLLLTQRLVDPLVQMSEIVDRYEDAKASTRRILGLMAVPVTVTDPDEPEQLAPVEGHVEYDDVTFRYESDGETVLDDVDVDVQPGETVGLVGPTGAGKTTILKLLLRLYDVSEGEIRVDGHDVRDVRLGDLRDAIGYVSQDTFLFDGTVRENIRYGTFDASDDAVEDAARKAEAHEFITNLPEGYDTRVGERGVKLSGGQRQRVAIARTVLKDPEILILDEATSAVDTETELLIQKSIDELAADRTTFAIAHRLSTIRDADRILVVEDGEIVERGPHEELVESGGIYANLWAVQAGDIEAVSEEFVEAASRRAAEASRLDGDDD